MNNLIEIKKEHSSRLDSLLNECKIFWAFSNEQFLANKPELEEGDKFVSIGAGGYMPKSLVDKYLQGSEELSKWYKKAIKETKGARRANIVYQLGNHEAWYTNSISDTLAALGQGYTSKEVWKVFNEEREKQEAA
jgi:hypothetical protein